jgi:hypothetical protein
MQSKSSIFILIVIVLLVVGGLVYFFAGGSDSTSSGTPNLGSGGLVSGATGQSTGIAVGTTGTSSTGDQVVALLRNLSTIQLNDAVFQHPGFGMLRDITITLPPVTSQGRRNPFAPISGDNAPIPVASPITETIEVPAPGAVETGGTSATTAPTTF